MPTKINAIPVMMIIDKAENIGLERRRIENRIPNTLAIAVLPHCSIPISRSSKEKPSNWNDLNKRVKPTTKGKTRIEISG